MNDSPTPTPPRDSLPFIYWSVFVICLALGGILFFVKREAPLAVPVVPRNVPAYHILTASDVTTKTIEAHQVVSDTVRDAQSLIGHYTREVLTASRPIHAGQIVAISDSRLISDTLAVGISANSATILGGNLRAGDVVSLAAVPISETASAATTVLDQVLVLDVKVSDKDTVVVLAIPRSHWLEYLDKTHNAEFVLARRIE